MDLKRPSHEIIIVPKVKVSFTVHLHGEEQQILDGKGKGGLTANEGIVCQPEKIRYKCRTCHICTFHFRGRYCQSARFMLRHC